MWAENLDGLINFLNSNSNLYSVFSHFFNFHLQMYEEHFELAKTNMSNAFK